MEGGTASINDVIREGQEIYHKVSVFYRDHPSHNEEAVKYIHNQLIKDHHEFAGAYPIVLRTIVYEKFFHPKVMKNYFVHISNNPWKTREEFLERQAEYLVYMLRFRCPRTEVKKIYEYRNMIIKQLKEEDKEFQSVYKKVTDECNKEADEAKQLRRERLLKLLQTQRDPSSCESSAPPSIAE